MIEIQNLSKSFGGIPACQPLAFRVETGALLWLQGVSGSGKTTLLRCLAGLETPDTGWIILGKQKVFGHGLSIEPHRRGVGMMFQDGALWPHLTMEGHLEFVLRSAGSGSRGRAQKRTRQKRVDELLELIELTERRRDRPGALSGGQQQRLAFARAIAAQPPFLLLDEPFSNLDERLRRKLMEEIRRLMRENQSTVLIAGHDDQEYQESGDQILRLTPPVRDTSDSATAASPPE